MSLEPGTLEACAGGDHLYGDPFRAGHSLKERVQFEKCEVCGQVDPVMMNCYLCSEFKPPARQVVRDFTGPGPDPTQVYILECGHHVI